MLPEVVDARFEIGPLVGKGGYGEVYRALDRQTGGVVAVKRLKGRFPEDESLRRFEREARALARTVHPRVVRYVAHGRDPDGGFYIATEWIEGELLSLRITRSPLAIDEAARIVVETAEGLAALHALGILHRDVKPSNIILVTEGERTHPKLIDLGFASVLDEPKLTAHGVVLGSPIYVAPEYARGEALTPSSDVYSLGVVFFEMLTGQRPFASSDPHVVLARVVGEEPPRVRSLRPELSLDLDALVARCLDKNPAVRFSSADDFASAVAALQRRTARSAAFPAAGSELGLDSTADARATHSTATAGAHGEKRVVAALFAWAGETSDRAAASHRIRTFGGTPQEIRGGRLLATFGLERSHGDEAHRAVRAGLALCELVVTARVGLALGRASHDKSGPKGEVVESAVEAFMNAQPGEVRVDPEMARQIEETFELRGDERGTRVAGPSTGAWRPALTPMIGREREIDVLKRLLAGAAQERTARILIVSGPAGMGKTRLVADVRADLAKSPSPPSVLVVRGDPSRRDVPLGALVRARYETAPHASSGALDDLGTLIRPFDTESFTHWLRESLERSPQWIIADDVHWIDPATLTLLTDAMRALHASPIVWTALCRPESLALVNLVAPDAAQMILQPLSAFACGQWMTAWHADALDDTDRRNIVARAGGNPRFLEQLVRAAVAGRKDDLPVAIHSVIQVQLDSLEGAARDAARAASVFGDTFWLEGLSMLPAVTDAEAAVTKLAELGVVVSRSPSRLVSFREYAFQQPLLRDAVYATLTPAQRETFHRGAAEWLEQSGEDDPSTLGMHWKRAGEVARALKLHILAARRRAANHDFEAAYIEWTQVLSLDEDARSRFESLLARADVALELAHADDAEHDATEALALAGRDPVRKLQVALRIAQCRQLAGRLEEAAQVLQDALANAERVQAPERYRAEAILRGAHLLAQQGRAATALTMARAVLDDPHISDEDLTPLQPLADQVVGLSTVALGHFDDALATYRAASRRAHRRADRARAIIADISVGFVCNQLGLYADAETILRAAFDAAERLRLVHGQGYAVHNLGLALARRGEYSAAIQAEDDAISIASSIGAPRLTVGANVYSALFLSERAGGGDFARAHTALDNAEPIAEAYAPLRAMAHAIRARLLLAQGELPEALRVAEESAALAADLDSIDEFEELIWLTHIEALQAAGRTDEARERLLAAGKRLADKAARIGDVALRESYLARVPEHARLIALASA